MGQEGGVELVGPGRAVVERQEEGLEVVKVGVSVVLGGVGGGEEGGGGGGGGEEGGAKV